MTTYNNNSSNNVLWCPDNRGYPYHSQGGHNGHRANHTSDNERSMDVTTCNEDEDLRLPVEGWPDCLQDNENDNNNSAAVAAYQPLNQEFSVDENSDAGSPYGYRGQYSEPYLQSFLGDATSHAPLFWDYHPQQTTVMDDSSTVQYTNYCEDNVSSQEEPGRTGFDPRVSCDAVEQEFPPEVDDASARYYRGGGPDSGPANMTTDEWFNPWPIAEQKNRRVYQQVDQYQYFPEARSDTHIIPQPPPQAQMKPSLARYTEASTQINMPTYSSDAPWSPENKRQNEQQESLDDITTKFVRKTGTSETQSGVTDYDYTNSIHTDDLDTSATSLYTDVDVIGSLETLRCDKQSFESQTPRGGVHCTLPAPESFVDIASGPGGAEFRFNFRGCTPPYDTGPSFANNMDSSSLSAENLGLLPVPPSHTSTSEASSPVSSASPSMPDSIYCSECFTEFTGEYRKGNRARHIRRKHRGRGVIECEDDNCDKTFKREDARLKHYRNCHPYLVDKPIIPRGPQGSRRLSQPRTPAGGHEPQEQVLSNLAGWAG